jgi:hypothetical protein
MMRTVPQFITSCRTHEYKIFIVDTGDPDQIEGQILIIRNQTTSSNLHTMDKRLMFIAGMRRIDSTFTAPGFRQLSEGLLIQSESVCWLVHSDFVP